MQSFAIYLMPFLTAYDVLLPIVWQKTFLSCPNLFHPKTEINVYESIFTDLKNQQNHPA
jgi:hypothetical protein